MQRGSKNPTKISPLSISKNHLSYSIKLGLVEIGNFKACKQAITGYNYQAVLKIRVVIAGHHFGYINTTSG
jgi:hypothetical protein